jgi:DnaJ-domain-containing protein 1
MKDGSSRFFTLHDALRERLDGLQRKINAGMEFALDHLLEHQIDHYFRHEEAFEELESLFGRVTADFDSLDSVDALKRFEARFVILEDRCEEIDAALRQRPMRRRQRINFFNFFRQSQGDNGQAEGSRPEVSSLSEAYEILGVEPDTRPALITAAFRKLVKEFHPDMNGGDRSHEPRLRKLMAAYQLIKAQVKA